MPKDNIIFTTDAIDAADNKPSIPPQIITANRKPVPQTKDDWWAFDLLRSGVLCKVEIAIAMGLDVKKTLREVAEYLLTIYRDEE